MCVCEHNPQSHAIKHVKSYFAFYTPGLYIKKEIELLYPPQNHVPNYIVEKLNKNKSISMKRINELINIEINRQTTKAYVEYSAQFMSREQEKLRKRIRDEAYVTFEKAVRRLVVAKPRNRHLSWGTAVAMVTPSSFTQGRYLRWDRRILCAPGSTPGTPVWNKHTDMNMVHALWTWICFACVLYC